VEHRANLDTAGSWTVSIGANAHQLAHLVHKSAPIAAAQVSAADHEVIVQGRPLGARRDCAWGVASALAPMWGDAVPADIDCTVVLAGTTYRTTGPQMQAVAAGADRYEWAAAVEVLVSA
jgi:hypothetical protein